MKLKFWRGSKELIAQNEDLQAEVNRLLERLAAIYQRTPAIVTEAAQKRANMERLMVLAGLGKGNALWNAVLSYADEHARNELMVALRPGLSDGERQFAAGRAANGEDFAYALRDLQARAELEASKLKG